MYLASARAMTIASSMSSPNAESHSGIGTAIRMPRSRPNEKLETEILKSMLSNQYYIFLIVPVKKTYLFYCTVHAL